MRTTSRSGGRGVVLAVLLVSPLLFAWGQGDEKEPGGDMVRARVQTRPGGPLLDAEMKVHVSPVDPQMVAADELRAGRPQIVLDGPFAATGDGKNRYAVAGNGERFLMLHEPETESEEHEHLQLVLHWFTELERTFSTSGGR